MDEMQDVKPQRKKSIEEENFNADIDRILDRISDLLRNQVNRLKIKPLFEELEIFFSGVPASQSYVIYYFFMTSRTRKFMKLQVT